MSIIENIERVGNFTSSKIVALTSNGRAKGSIGKPAETYILEKNMERRHGRSLNRESNARPLTWGKLCEKYVGESGKLGMDYALESDVTHTHPHYNYWTGSIDGCKYDGEEVVGIFDLKCPIELKSFSGLVDPIYDLGLTGIDAMRQIRQDHKDGDKYYWQLVSNAAIHGVKYAELIVFCPFQDELDEIREVAANMDGADQRAYFWIDAAEDIELPYLLRNRLYENITVIGFEIPEEDFQFLERRVQFCGAMLIDRKL